MKKKRFWNQPAQWDNPRWVAKMHSRYFGHMTDRKKCVCGRWLSELKARPDYVGKKTANPTQDLREKEGYF